MFVIRERLYAHPVDSKIRKTGDTVEGLISAYSKVHSTINQLSTVTCTTKQAAWPLSCSDIACSLYTLTPNALIFSVHNLTSSLKSGIFTTTVPERAMPPAVLATYVTPTVPKQ